MAECTVRKLGGKFGPMDVQIEEEDRQAILLAIAKLALARPGFDYMLGEIADKLGGRAMYDTFKSHGPDPVR